MRYCMLDKDGNVTFTEDVREWALWLETTDRTIGRDVIDGVEVSTAIVGCTMVGNALGDQTEDYYFETMLFGTDDVIEYLNRNQAEDCTSIFNKVFGGWSYQRRYRTLGEARGGHAETVAYVRRMMAARN
jgi:hypothetical protein